MRMSLRAVFSLQGLQLYSAVLCDHRCFCCYCYCYYYVIILFVVNIVIIFVVNNDKCIAGS
jgi:hypothetical protein